MLWTPSLPHAKYKQMGHQENAPPHHCPSTAITTGWSPEGELQHLAGDIEIVRTR